MIAKLSGRLDSTSDGEAIIDVGGVGYLLFCSARTLSQLGSVGDAVSLVTETHVREDHIHLYGFATTIERDWFRLLQSVQGVGARMALGVLSVLTPDALALAIGAQDKATVQQVSGIGGKLATRIVTELRDKVPTLGSGQVLHGDFGGGYGDREGGRDGAAASDAVSALVNLGYRPAEALSAVSMAARDLGAGSQVGDLIRIGLKELAR